MKIFIAGVGGKMGRVLTRLCYEHEHIELIGGTENPQSKLVGTDIGELAGIGKIGIKAVGDPLELFTKAEGLIDFTRPEYSIKLVELSAQARISHIIGTTGFDGTMEDKIKFAANHARIVKSGNMSLGVNLLASLSKKIASSLSDDFDIEILEMHHNQKVDAPSGTALMLGQAAAEGRGVDLDDKGEYTRYGNIGTRKKGEIGFATLRGGDVVGEHEVIFSGFGERIIIKHIASNREIFARGALQAALWTCGKEPGLYNMNDVLGI